MPIPPNPGRSQGRIPLRSGDLLLALIVIVLAVCASRRVRADEAPPYSWTPWNPCPHCDLLVGAGTTFDFQNWTDGVVFPVTLEIDDSRWELGAFRLATAQYLKEEPQYPASTRSSNPEWGFDALRRWQVLHRSWGKLYLGFGANYKTESDLIDYKWNFAYLVGIRFDVGSGSIVELSVRHWSNAWFRSPNRGQNLLIVSFGL
jgi:hypothetical protein